MERLVRFCGSAVFGDVEASHFTGCRGSRVSFNYLSILIPLSQTSPLSSFSVALETLFLAEQKFVEYDTRGNVHCCGSHSGHRLPDRSSSRMAPCHGRRVCSTCSGLVLWIAPCQAALTSTFFFGRVYGQRLKIKTTISIHYYSVENQFERFRVVFGIN